MSLSWIRDRLSHIRFAKIFHTLGDILIFGSVLAHRSGPNSTDKRRAAVFGTYHFEVDRTDLREKYYAHRRLYFPPDHGKVLAPCLQRTS